MTTSRWHRAGLTACFGLMLVVNLQSVSEDFLYGHKGWCAARRAVAGRNFVREGFVAARFGPVENTSPTIATKAYKHYWHHPVGIHLLVGASFSVFGVGEWQARLVPILLMLASFLLFADLARRWWPTGPGRWAALIFFATTPMLAYYGPFVNQEPVVLLACLASVWTYTRWRETSGAGWVMASVGVAFISAWSDWPWFIFAFCLAVLAAARMLRTRRLDLQWFAPYCAAVLLGFGVVLWHLSLLQGGDDFFKAFSDLGSFRHSGKGKTLGDVFSRQTAPWLDLFTPTLVLAALIWPVRAAVEARRGRWSDKHSVALAFLVLGFAWVAIFKHGAWVHDFWPMFTGVYVVVAGADLVVDLTNLAARAGRHWPRGPWSQRLAAGVAAGLIVTQGAAGLAGTSHRVRFADPNPKEGEDFRHRHAVMARWVNENTSEDDEIALDHPIFKASFQLGFYLDRKRRKIRIKESTRKLRVRTRTAMVVIDLRRAPQAASHALLNEAVGTYPVTLLDDFLIIDRRRKTKTPEVSCWRLVDEPASWLHTWLVSAIYPPQSLVRDLWMEADLLRVTGHSDLALDRRQEAPPPATARQHVAAHNLALLAKEHPRGDLLVRGARDRARRAHHPGQDDRAARAHDPPRRPTG